MKKIGEVLYNKLMLQAEEAEYRGMTRLAENVKSAIGSKYEEQYELYSQNELEDDIHSGLWKLATCVLKYHNLYSADVEKIDQVIESLASQFVEEIETVLDTDPRNTTDPLLPGETK